MYKNSILKQNVEKTIKRIEELEAKLEKTVDVNVIRRIKAELKIQKNSLEAYRMVGNV